MLVRNSVEMEDEEVRFLSEKKLKFESEFAAGPSNGVVASTSIVSSKPALPKLSEVVTKKNFNKLVLASRILDGKWNLSDVDIVSTLKRDTRFKQVVEEKLKGYKSQPYNNLVNGLKGYKAKKEDLFGLEQRRRESQWKPDCYNLSLSKETFQLQPLLDHGNCDGYAIESVQSGGTADIVLTMASTTEDPISWSEKLLLPVYLPIEAKSSFKNQLNGKQRSSCVRDLAGHPECAAFISLYQYDSASNPHLFSVILPKKVAVLLRYISVKNDGMAQLAYSSTISKETLMITAIVWNANMKKVVKDKDVVVRTINDFTAEQLEEPEWIIRQFIVWADLKATLTIADFQSDSLNTQKGNICEELTSIAFHSVNGAKSRPGQTVTSDKVDVWMVSGEVERSISCKTVKTYNGDVKQWCFPLYEMLKGKRHVPVTYERSCDIWTATLHSDLINPNFITLKAPDRTHWILFVFTKSQLKDRLGSKTFKGLKAGEHLDKSIYFDSSKKILNPDAIDRLICPLFQK